MSWASAIPFIGPAIQGIGAIFGGVQGYQTAKFNQTAANQQAASERQIAAENANREREVGQRTASAGVAAAAKAGVVPTEGSPVQVALDTYRQSELKALDEIFAGEVRATDLKNQSKLYGYQKKMSIVSGVLGVGAAAARGYGDYRAANPVKSPSISGGPAKP